MGRTIIGKLAGEFCCQKDQWDRKFSSQIGEEFSSFSYLTFFCDETGDSSLGEEREGDRTLLASNCWRISNFSHWFRRGFDSLVSEMFEFFKKKPFTSGHLVEPSNRDLVEKQTLDIGRSSPGKREWDFQKKIAQKETSTSTDRLTVYLGIVSSAFTCLPWIPCPCRLCIAMADRHSICALQQECHFLEGFSSKIPLPRFFLEGFSKIPHPRFLLEGFSPKVPLRRFLFQDSSKIPNPRFLLEDSRESLPETHRDLLEMPSSRTPRLNKNADKRGAFRLFRCTA